MKRIYAGIVILALLLGAALLFAHLMERIYTPLENTLLEAADAALLEDWRTAEELCRRARDRWERYKRVTAILADHSPMDDIDGLFGELEIYLQQQEMPHFAATCHHLARLSQAMGENHALNWWNFL